LFFFFLYPTLTQLLLGPGGWEEGNLDTYNNIEDWWPTDNENYPGAGDLKGPYFLGYWAGITIESAHVILNLNGFTLEQSHGFYHQQAFFTLISIANQYFMPGQGSGFFGGSPTTAKNIIIKNGNLGLSSHHGIFGQLIHGLLIENMKVSNFKTHGIQLNGFRNVVIRDVEIGPNQYKDKLSPFYVHLRQYLPIHRKMAEDIKGKTICLDFFWRSFFKISKFNRKSMYYDECFS